MPTIAILGGIGAESKYRGHVKVGQFVSCAIYLAAQAQARNRLV